MIAGKKIINFVIRLKGNITKFAIVQKKRNLAVSYEKKITTFMHLSLEAKKAPTSITCKSIGRGGGGSANSPIFPQNISTFMNWLHKKNHEICQSIMRKSQNSIINNEEREILKFVDRLHEIKLFFIRSSGELRNYVVATKNNEICQWFM